MCLEVDEIMRQVQFAAGRDLRPGQLGSMIQTLSNWLSTLDNLLISIQEKIKWADSMSELDKKHRKEVEDRVEEVKKSLSLKKIGHPIEMTLSCYLFIGHSKSKVEGEVMGSRHIESAVALLRHSNFWISGYSSAAEGARIAGASRIIGVGLNPKSSKLKGLPALPRFKAAFEGTTSTCATLLSQLKVLLTQFRSLPPLFEDTPNAIHELSLARDTYEHAVVLSVKTEDQDAFERDFFQLKPYYTDAGNRLPPSPQEHPILGLNLLRLLVQNRIAEFHTELELLSPTALENPCIKHAVELEQSFMEGAYNRVLSARQTVPHDTYVYFMDLLAKTVRDEIAGCGEKAYDYLSINDARQMFLYTSEQELLEYIKEELEWEIKGSVFFQRQKSTFKEIFSAIDQPDAELRKRVGADCVKES
uniref:PCI domain-containing protein n=1 Tax=Fagus sylvatica TaxID=28930 RepID=A0A2N9IH87_FAGSY